MKGLELIMIKEGFILHADADWGKEVLERKMKTTVEFYISNIVSNAWTNYFILLGLRSRFIFGSQGFVF